MILSIGPRRAAAAALLAGALLLVVTVQAATDTEGWVEVVSTRVGVDGTDAAPGEVSGPADRLWMTRPGDTLASIALHTTGSPSRAVDIARYNGLADGAILTRDRVLYIPASLLPRVESKVATWEIREFDIPAEPDVQHEGSSAVTIVPEAPAVTPPDAVAQQPLDLFAGEVTVLGEVSVSRVAIGNGTVVRAEVLDGGELLVIAQSAGSSSLRLWHSDGRQSDYNIRVSESDPEIRVRMERMVRMRVRMVEFRRNALGKLGIDWADGAAGPGLATVGDVVGNNLYRPEVAGFEGLPTAVQPFSTYFGIASNITSRINFLSSSGEATTLAEPVLTAANGGTASFLAGGEVPYPSTGSDGQTTVSFKEYGIQLEVAPRIDSAGNVRTGIKTEISQLDPAVSVQGAPGLLTRRAQTEVNVRSGQTIVISGLLSSESSSDVDKLPGIGNLPIIGAFFRSKNRRSAVSELVIFVTPEVIDPAEVELDELERQRFARSTQALSEARSQLPLLD